MSVYSAVCNLSVPYPPIKTNGKNMYYASLLTSDFAGTTSEMSAFSEYTYQQIISSKPKVSNILHGISKIELYHMQTLGELIILLGGNPRLAVQSGCNCIFWNAQNISYESNPKIFLKDNISAEKATIANYRTRINQINDINVKRILERIILDEEHHVKLFSILLKELD